MKSQNSFVVSLLIVLAVLILGAGGGYYLSQMGPSSVPRTIPGGTPDLGPSSENDPAFLDPNYKKVSNISRTKKEHTVVYEYTDDPNNSNYEQYFSPCGTLVTQFSKVGSVRVGRGPVYKLASEECKVANNEYVPNDFSFRAYACENFQYTSPVTKETGIVGRATFAFQCGPANEDTRCAEARINGVDYKQDWNCSGI